MTMSVVVVDRGAPEEARRACIEALRRELRDHDQIVWVGRTSPATGMEHVLSNGGARGELYAAGRRRAANDVIAFTDSVTAVCTGWRDAALTAIDAGAVGVGGPVVATTPRSAASWAGFFVEYGPHAVAPYASASGDVAANNVAYDAGALDGVLRPDEALWKTLVNARLVASGGTIAVVPSMVVRSQKRYRGRDLLAGRAAHGRLYAGQRAAGWPLRRRMRRAVATLALPALAFVRLARQVRSDAALTRRFVAVSPLVVAALTAWSAGEIIGYVRGCGQTEDVF